MKKLVLIAGPCVLEDAEMVFEAAKKVKSAAKKFGFEPVFKASFDKANRLSGDSYRGVGIEHGLEILCDIKKKLGLKITTDAHEVWQVKKIADVADIIQVPAFLCRQTDLVLAAAETKKIVNIKKGQFLAPWDMKSIIKKIGAHASNGKVWITERGSCFGYNRLVVDMVSLEYLKQTGCKVFFDSTHSLQLPGGLGNATGGQREFVFALSRAAAAVGVDGFFMEIHPKPEKAFSDSATSLDYKKFEELLRQIKSINNAMGPLNKV